MTKIGISDVAIMTAELEMSIRLNLFWTILFDVYAIFLELSTMGVVPNANCFVFSGPQQTITKTHTIGI